MATPGALISPEPASCGQKFTLFFKVYWKSMVVMVTPLALMPILILWPTPAHNCLYIILVMMIYWITEALPPPVTAMLPIICFPCFRVLDTESTCQAYMKSGNYVFLAGMMIGGSLIHSKLNRRLSLKVVQIIGCSHRRLCYGLSLVTMFLSMWISNTGAIIAMLPVTMSILEVLEANGLGDVFYKDPENENIDPSERKPSRVTTCFLLTIAYSASIGGISTLVASPPILTMLDSYERRYKAAPRVNYTYWMAYHVVLMLIMHTVTWMFLQATYMGLFRPESDVGKLVNGQHRSELARQYIDEMYDGLGRLSFHEKITTVLLTMTLILFSTKNLGYTDGWADMLSETDIRDSCACALTIMLMFILPCNLEVFNYCTAKTIDGIPKRPTKGVLTWTVFTEHLPWGLWFLMGAGFVLSDGAKASGLTALLRDFLTDFKDMDPVCVILLTVIFCQIFTNLSSNTAVSNIVLPVLAELSPILQLHPLYTMIPAATACCMSFHLPVSSPPNAIVATAGNIRSLEMLLAGICPSLIGTILIWGGFVVLGDTIFPDTNTYPDWVA